MMVAPDEIPPAPPQQQQKKTPTVEDLLEGLRKGKTVHDDFSARLRTQFLISGRPMSEWEEEFRLNLSADLDPAKCRELLGVVLRLYEQVTFHKAHAEAVTIALSSGIDNQYNSRYAALAQEHKDGSGKLPAGSTLATLAKNELQSLTSAQACGEIAHHFWKEIQDHLGQCRKILENAIIAASVEAKLQPHA